MKKYREDSAAKRRAISTKEFISSGTPNKLKERDSSSERSYVSINNSFNSANDQAARLKWIRDVKIKNGSFRLGKSIDASKNKNNSYEIITLIRKKIASDWQSTDFDIGVNKAGLFEIRFFMNTVESNESMHYYMNILINKSLDIGRFCLKKVQNK